MGTGFNYIREIMQMNLPEESTPKPLREYEKEAKRLLNERFGTPKKFHYRYELRYPIRDNCDRDVCVIVDSANRWCHYEAGESDVVMHNGKLYTWTGEKWVQFIPGPCTDYDGPNPYEKTVYISTAAAYDSPIAEAIRENLKKSLDKAGVIGLCEIERVSDTEIVAKYDIKYLGETFTDVRKYHDNRVVWLRHPIRVYNQVRHEANIGEMVDYDGLRYVWNGNQWIEYPKHEKLAMEWPKTNKEENNMAPRIRYIGKSTSVVKDGSTTKSVRVHGEWVNAEPGDIVMYDYDLYVFGDHDPMKLTYWKKISDGMFSPPGTQYNKIPANWLAIKKVHFSGDKTIVMWADGTKTIVSCGENEEFDPEKGLTMAIAKKAFGNQGNYYNQIKKWLPKKEETIEQVIEPDPAQEYMDSTRDLITDMALNGATKAELVRAIRFSKELIDGFKATPSEKPDFNPFKLEKDYGITTLREKYQKSKKTK